jgi:hypothetical protein
MQSCAESSRCNSRTPSSRCFLHAIPDARTVKLRISLGWRVPGLHFLIRQVRHTSGADRTLQVYAACLRASAAAAVRRLAALPSLASLRGGVEAASHCAFLLHRLPDRLDIPVRAVSTPVFPVSVRDTFRTSSGGSLVVCWRGGAAGGDTRADGPTTGARMGCCWRASVLPSVSAWPPRLRAFGSSRWKVWPARDSCAMRSFVWTSERTSGLEVMMLGPLRSTTSRLDQSMSTETGGCGGCGC